MSDLIVSVSGIRGIVGEGLTPGAALAFAQALATHTGGGSIAVSNDGRPSGVMLRHADPEVRRFGLYRLTDTGLELPDVLAALEKAAGTPGWTSRPGWLCCPRRRTWCAGWSLRPTYS